jgi:hypothetical protein
MNPFAELSPIDLRGELIQHNLPYERRSPDPLPLVAVPDGGDFLLPNVVHNVTDVVTTHADP